MSKLKKVILVDDSEATNILNKKILENMDIANEILVFSEGQSLLNYLKSEEQESQFPELILLDIEMPKMGGFDFLEEYIDLSEKRNLSYEPIIAIVSDHLDYDNFSKSKLFKTYGVLEHIRKPMDKQDIQDLLEEHFGWED